MKPYPSVHWPFHLGWVKIFSLASKIISRHKDFPAFSAWRTPRIITSCHFHLKRGRSSVNFYNSQKQVLFISYNVMQTLLTYLNWANGASQMDCTSRLLFPSLGLRNKIRTYNHHGEWQPLYRRSSGPALPLGGLVAQLCGCPPLREKNHRTVLWQCWPDNSW